MQVCMHVCVCVFSRHGEEGGVCQCEGEGGWTCRRVKKADDFLPIEKRNARLLICLVMHVVISKSDN